MPREDDRVGPGDPEALAIAAKNKLRFGHAAIEAIRFSWTISPTTRTCCASRSDDSEGIQTPRALREAGRIRSGGEQSEEDSGEFAIACSNFWKPRY